MIAVASDGKRVLVAYRGYIPTHCWRRVGHRQGSLEVGQAWWRKEERVIGLHGSGSVSLDSGELAAGYGRLPIAEC